MADYLPKYLPGKAVTFTTSDAVVGGTLVAVSGSGTVATAGADAVNVVGVAGHDAASGDRVVVFTRGGGVQRLISAGVIAAGAQVISAADGEIATIGGGSNPIGIALETAAADDVIDVLFI